MRESVPLLSVSFLQMLCPALPCPALSCLVLPYPWIMYHVAIMVLVARDA